MDKIFEIFKNIKIDFSKTDLKKIVGYVSISTICYILIPLNVLEKIWSKLFDNKLLNIAVIIFVLSFFVYILDIIINKIITYIKKKKQEDIDLALLEDKFNTLDFDCKVIISEFYNKELNLFSPGTKLMPTTSGIDVLKRMDIIYFNDYVDEEGGYSIRKEQLYMINDKYFYFLNKLAKSKKESKFMEFMRNI